MYYWGVGWAVIYRWIDGLELLTTFYSSLKYMLLPLVGVMAICGCALATSVASDCRLFYSADVRWQPMLLQTAACCILRMCADSLCCFRLPLVVLCGCALATSVASDCRLYFADVCWQPLLLQTAACMSIPDGALAYPPLWIVTDCPLTRDRVLTAGGTVTDCSIS